MVSFLEIEGGTLRGVFRERPNRFLARVSVDNEVLPCFLPNPGRMQELFIPGVEVILREAVGRKRKTGYDLIGVVYQGEMVSVDSRVPNKLVVEAFKQGELAEFADYTTIKAEYGYGHSRLDFLFTNEGESCLVEVKSCTLVKDGVALFPDAPTVRGRRHLRELIHAKKEGYRACVLFMIQRRHAQVFTSNDATDPAFGHTLREAVATGVEAYAYSSEFVGNRITLKGTIKVDPNLSGRIIAHNK